MKRPFVIISGIGPSYSGTGALMQWLVAAVDGDVSVRFVYKKERGRNLRKLLEYVINRTGFRWMVRRTAKSEGEVILFHPQTIGLRPLRDIVEARDHTWMYVLDASIFCLRSYNCLPAESAPCLRCLGNDGSAAALNGCVNGFGSGPFQKYLPGWVRSGKLRLIAQCETQAELLRAHFGRETRVAVVPLAVPDITPPQGDFVRPKRERPLAVYHGACNPAKGIAHAVSLAKLMPDWDFLLPSSLHDLNRDFGRLEPYPSNLITKSMGWTSGLSEQVKMADLVLCPSSWSAPVEGAVLKSLAHNGLVGLYVHETSFAAEVPPEARVAIDPRDLEGTAARLRRLISNPDEAAEIRSAALRFISQYSEQSQSMLSSLRATCGLT